MQTIVYPLCQWSTASTLPPATQLHTICVAILISLMRWCMHVPWPPFLPTGALHTTTRVLHSLCNRLLRVVKPTVGPEHWAALVY